MCESLRFSNSVSLSCSTFTIRGYLTMNKYNTNGEIINTICLSLLGNSRFGKHYRSCTCLRISFRFHQLQICFTQAIAMIIISDTVSQHHPSPRATKAAPPTTHEHDKEWRALEESENPGEDSISWSGEGGGRSDDMTGHGTTVGLSNWLQSAILSQGDGKCCP